MIINFRYHVVTLVAIFMALTVGIFVGSFLQGDDVVMQQQEMLTERIASQLTVLNEKNQQLQTTADTLKQQNTYFQQFEQNVFPVLGADLLTDRRLLIVNTGNQALPNNLSSNLALTGAKVDLVLTIKNQLRLEDSALVMDSLGWTKANILDSSLEPGAAGGEEAEITSEMVRNRLMLEITRLALTGNQNNFWGKLMDLGLVQADGEALGGINGIILVGGTDSAETAAIQSLDLPLIQYAQASGIRICGAEISTAPYSFINEYQSLAIDTVDNLEYISGQYAAVLLLAGANGNYGIKTTAKALIPDRSALNY